MNITPELMMYVNTKKDVQIDQMEQYIEELEAQVKELRNKLNAKEEVPTDD